MCPGRARVGREVAAHDQRPRAEESHHEERLDCVLCFFFQAEDGIRDLTVTGVQTCALPICTQDFTSAKLTLNSNLLPKRVWPLEYPADELLITNYLAHHGLGVEVHGCGVIDRKSTRLNSSHSQISYAVFCL